MSLINRFINLFYTIPVVREVGWWSLKKFSIDSLQFNKITDGNASDPFLRGEVIVTGCIFSEHNTGIPKIKNFHISERFEMRNDEQICIVVISPIVVYVPTAMSSISSLVSESYSSSFKHSIPISIHSWQWGKNTVVFASGNQTHEITFSQSK